MTISPDRAARITISLGVQPPAAAVHQLVVDEGAHRALDYLKRRTAPEAPQAEFRAPNQADLRRLLRDYQAAPYRFVIPTDDEWPATLDRLSEVDASAIGFWAWSRRHLSAAANPVAITGTERPSPVAHRATVDIATSVAACGQPLALVSHPGVPRVALQTTLAADHPADAPPIVVLTHGFHGGADPREYEAIVHAGGVVLTEYAPGVRTARSHRDAADRLIAGLGLSMVVVDPTSPVTDTRAASIAAALHGMVVVASGAADRATPDAITELIDAGDATLISAHDLAPMPAGATV